MAGWKTVEEVVAYQLSVQLRDDIVRLTSSGPVSLDYRFRDQIRDAAASAPRNLSEGFYRYNHGEFAFLANVAKASLAETKTQLDDGRNRNYFSEEDFRATLPTLGTSDQSDYRPREASAIHDDTTAVLALTAPEAQSAHLARST